MMNPPNLNCQPEKLSDLLVGTLSDIESDAMLSHLETCPHCQVKLESLAAQDSQWKNAVEILAAAPNASLSSIHQTREHPSIRDKGLQWTESLSRKLLSAPSHPEMLGKIGRYDVERFVGAGGMGIVFKGFDTELNRPVAIKVLSPSLAFNGTARQRFAREARAAAAVVHEHVVPIYNVESNGELPFLVMHFAQGESLQSKIDREGPLELKQILRIGKQIASGLAAAHAQGLVHRDVKPANVLIEEGIDRALLTDFGLAQTADDASLTCSGYLPGTPQYMSPEQARGEKVSGLSDLFSTGSVLYAMSTGRPPFRAETSLGVLRKINDSEPKNIREINADMPDWFCRIVERLMAKRPEDRYGSAQELAELLENCLAHVQQPLHVPLPTTLRMPSSFALFGDKIRRHPFRLVIGLFLLGVLGFVLWPTAEGIEPTHSNDTKSSSGTAAPNGTAASSGTVDSNTALSSNPAKSRDDVTNKTTAYGPSALDTPADSQKPEFIVWKGPPLPRVPQDDVRAKLETNFQANWQNQSLETVLQELLGSAQLEFDLRPQANNSEIDKPMISLQMSGSRRLVLQRVLQAHDLGYIVHEANLEIAENEYVTRHPTLHRYDLSFVTSNSNEAYQLMNLIVAVVEPAQWTDQGGACSLGFTGPILHVRATETMHQQIAELLAKLNR
jgi:serine/threonine protein kinase